MQSLVKALLIFGVLITGIALALVFRKSETEDSTEGNSASETAQAEHAEAPAKETPKQQGVPPKPERTDITDGSAQAPGHRVIDGAPSESPNATIRRPPLPPPVFRTKQPGIADVRPIESAPSVGVETPIAANGNGELHVARIPDVPQPSNFPATELASEVPEVRSHTIVNGDTLERIARRYLGSETRHNEIFELNRDIISDPDILPIGRSIAIPPRKGSFSPQEVATSDSVASPPPLVALPTGVLNRPD
jgi:nucleoid-associated protein YgaU